MRLVLLSFLLSVFCVTTQAQDWVAKKTSHEASFYEKQVAFNEYWEGKEYEKGKGYKQFKRWEWFWEPRVDAEGNFPAPTHVWDEYHRYTAERRTVGANSRTNAAWEPLGPSVLTSVASSPGIGRTSCVAQDPTNDNIIYVGTPGGGLWKSTDAGSSWNPMTDHLPTLGVSGVVVDPVDTDIIYIATGDGDGDDTYSVGVLKSFDGGVTWQATGLAWETFSLETCKRLIMSPVDHLTLFVATSDGLWKTHDAGETWSSVLGGEVEDIEFHPTNPSIIYASANNVYRSVDGGSNFDVVLDGLPGAGQVARIKIAVSPDEPDWVYAVAGRDDDNGFLGLYRSTDAGQSYSLRSDSPNILGWRADGSDFGGQAWYDLAVAADPDNANRVFVGGVNLWRSNNGGASWTIRAHWVFPSVTGAYVHADIHQLEYIGSRLYCMSDGGIYTSTNDAQNFTDITAGIVNSQFYKLGTSATDEGFILGGAQDNGTIRLDNNNWGQIYGGDGMECAVNPVNPNVFYVSTQYGNIARTTNGGFDFTNWVQDIPETGAWVTPFMLDPSNPNIIYAGFESLWKRTGNGNWQQLSPALSNINEFNIAPSNSDVIYVARGSSLNRTTDGGDDWEYMDLGLGVYDITDICFNPEDEDEVFVTLSGYGVGRKVARTQDGGETWENITHDLPNLPANAIVYEPGSNGGLYLGMDVGIYYTNNDLVGWIPYDEGLPRVVVSELEFHEASSKLRVATYGRGIWESPLFSGIQDQPVAQFAADRIVVCAGDTVNYTDESIYHEVGWDWSFPGATPASSSVMNPEVVYNTPGTFEVSLSVSNDLGLDEETKTAYIHVLPSIGEDLPLTEDFESITDFDASDDWFVFNPDQDETWEERLDIGFNSSQCIWLRNSVGLEDQIDEFSSISIDLTGHSEIELSMDVAFAQKTEENRDRLKIYASSDCGENYTLRKTFSGHTTLKSVEPQTEEFFPSSDLDWHNLVVDNIDTSYFSSNFRFIIQLKNDGGNNIFIDNINLYSTGVGLADLDRANLNLQLLPNPTEGQSTLKFALVGTRSVSYHVSDMTGRVLLSQKLGRLSLGEHQVQVDASSWSSGLYVLTLDVDGKTQPIRWVVK